jgi:hypothetical protein
MGKSSESVCHICVVVSVSPVVGPGQVVDSPDEDDSCYVVLTLLSIQFRVIQLFYFESKVF